MRLEPLNYQLEALEQLRAGFRKGHSAALLVMVMSAGKTITAMELMRLCAEKGKRSLFLCDRRMLVDQAVKVAREQGLEAGVLMAGRGSNWSAPCQFASKQTLESWLKRGIVELPEFDLIVVDEAHRAVSETFMRLAKRWPQAYRVGLTATPCLGNGGGMGAYYHFMVQPVQPSQLRSMGRIVSVRAFAPHIPNIRGVKTGKDGDWIAKDLSARLTRANLIGDVCGWWKRLGEGRPSVYFGCDIAHAMAMRDEFKANDVSCEMICDETPDDEREDIKQRSESGEIQVVVNCDVLAEGVDWPWISCIGLVRPTKRLRRYLQSAGRGMRACPGKQDMLLIDHAGCVLFHGMPDTDRQWPLDPGDNADKKNQEKRHEQVIIRCAKCFAMFTGTRTCPECGHLHIVPRLPKEAANASGTLVEFHGDDLDEETKKILHQRYWGTCIGVAIKRHSKAGMAAGMFSKKFGLPPWQAGVSPLPESFGDWQRPARDVFPGFVRGQRYSAGDSYEG